MYQSLFFNKVAGLVQVFSCEFYEIFKDIFFVEHLRATAFVCCQMMNTLQLKNHISESLSSYGQNGVRGVLQEKVFLEILQNSQENTCARVSLLERDSGTGAFL